MTFRFNTPFVIAVLLCGLSADGEESALTRHWLWTTAHAIPSELTSEESGYFSIVEGKNGRLYIGTAKYGANAFLVEFDPTTKKMKSVVDAQKEIGTAATGFAAQSKFHTRNNVGRSGKIYLGTKQVQSPCKCGRTGPVHTNNENRLIRSLAGAHVVRHLGCQTPEFSGFSDYIPFNWGLKGFATSFHTLDYKLQRS